MKANSATATIASKRAAEVYGLEILIEKLEDNAANYIRFLAISKAPLVVEDPEEYVTIQSQRPQFSPKHHSYTTA